MDLLNQVKIDGEDLNIIDALIQSLEDNKNNVDLVLMILTMLSMQIAFVENPENHALELEKFLTILGQLDVKKFA